MNSDKVLTRIESEVDTENHFKGRITSFFGKMIINKSGMGRKIGVRDLKAGTKLFNCLTAFDARVFAGNLGGVDFIFEDGQEDFVAHYDYEEDKYYIHLPGLSKNLTSRHRVVLNDSENVLSSAKVFKNSFSESLIIIAAHEVRHRLQVLRDAKLLSRERSSESNFQDLLRPYILFYEDCVFSEYTDFRDRSSENGILFHAELDANIIDSIVAHKLHYGTSFDELVEILQI